MAVQLSPVAPADAIAALASRGQLLDPSFAWQDRYAEDHAQAFTVAKSAGFDILTEIHAALETALKEGKTPKSFAAELTPLLQAKGWWGRQSLVDPATGQLVTAQLGSPRRLQLIFDVNMRVSYAAGQWANIERNRASRPFLRYVHLVGQEHPRLHHEALHNIVLPIEHPFWDTHFAPNGWNCHCTVQSLSQRDVDRLLADGERLRFEPPPVRTERWENKRTGEVRAIPQGIDPGWDYNPGKAGHQSALAVAERLVGAPPELAARIYDEPQWLARPLAEAFAAWFDTAARGGPLTPATVVVGAIEKHILGALEQKGRAPLSGAITVTQQQIQHMVRDSKAASGRAVPVDLLRQLPGLMAMPRAVMRDRRSGDLLYVFDAPEGLAKIFIRLDFKSKAVDPEGRRQPVISNAIRTAGIVQRADLADTNFYELLFGVL